MTAELTKLSFNAYPATITCLEKVAELTGDTQTDSGNRAIQFYAHMMAHMARGTRLLLVNREGPIEEVTLGGVLPDVMT